MDPATFLIVGMLAICFLSPFLAAEGRPAFKRPERKPRPMVSSMRRSDWPPSEFGP